MARRKASRIPDTRYADAFEAKPVDQALHLIADVAVGGDDQRFRQCPSGDHDAIFGFEHGNASVSSRLVEHDGHQCRGVDRDHSGRPSAP